jgi:hypothetical protein
MEQVNGEPQDLVKQIGQRNLRWLLCLNSILADQTLGILESPRILEVQRKERMHETPWNVQAVKSLNSLWIPAR